MTPKDELAHHYPLAVAHERTERQNIGLFGMDVLLIDPPGAQKSGYNLGLAYLAGSLQATGVDVGILDANHTSDPEVECHRFLAQLQPAVIGLSIRSATYAAARHLAKVARSVCPRAVVVAGGPHVTISAATFLEEAPEFHFAFAGEAEQSFATFVVRTLGSSHETPWSHELPGLCWREGDREHAGVRTLIADLDALPLPALEAFVNLDVRRMPYQMLTSRGCPFPCAFCSVGTLSGKKWRSRSEASVVAEIRHFLAVYGNPTFEIDDDNFTLDMDRAKGICRAMSSIAKLPGWSCPNGLRADRMDSELAELMSQAHCDSVAFGVESGSRRVLAAVGKGESLEQIEAAARCCRAAGLRTWSYFVLGLPHSSLADDIESLLFDRRGVFDERIFNMFVPYPGTPAWQWCRDHGRFLRDYRDSLHFGADVPVVFDTPEYPWHERTLAKRLSEPPLVELSAQFLTALHLEATRPEPAICLVEAESYRSHAKAEILGDTPALTVRLANAGGGDSVRWQLGSGTVQAANRPSRTNREKLNLARWLLALVRQHRIRLLILPHSVAYRLFFLLSSGRWALFYDYRGGLYPSTKRATWGWLIARLGCAIAGRPPTSLLAENPPPEPYCGVPKARVSAWRLILRYVAQIALLRLKRRFGRPAGAKEMRCVSSR